MGFIEETGAAQHYRDARILPIYEGTNGIQAIDLATRKLPLEGGAVVTAYIGELKKTAEEVRASNRPEFGRMGERLAAAVDALAEASRWMGGALQKSPEAALAGAQPYLRLFGLAAGGTYWRVPRWPPPAMVHPVPLQLRSPWRASSRRTSPPRLPASRTPSRPRRRDAGDALA